MHRHSALIAAVALAVLLGHVRDKTTGQPLSGVVVEATNAHVTLTARTTTSGNFRFARVAPGHYTLKLHSSDIPPQTFEVDVRKHTEKVNLRACSTTLDYSCFGVDGGGGGA
ncbi:MAG: carboxypeptidase-like regulatory domain-containing protein [Candidatus Eremiobacteraeota bacterium]|nr:carboxypeptidase-like regulatory domain-containing protein [Candidatus Eremiobacteraeota bacterium]